MAFLRRQLVTAALTANAIRPVPGFRAGIPAFAAGWLTSELAPHLFALTAADTAAHLTPKPAQPGRTAAGRGQPGRAGVPARPGPAGADQDAEDALVEGLGYDYLEQLDAKPTPAELATPWRRLVNPFRMRALDVRRREEHPYAPEHGKRGLLDIYRPAAGTVENAPVLLQVHGGGWTIGNKDQQGIPLMQHLAAKGWVCVAINYRLAPRDPFPAQIIDVKRAIAWIRENIAEYGGDPDYIAITGGSAGGHLTALAAVTPNDPDYQPGFEDADTSVAVAVPHYGVYDFSGSTGLRSAELMRDTVPRARACVKQTLGGRTRGLRGRHSPAPDHQGGAGLLRPARRPRHAGLGRAGAAVRRPAARDQRRHRRVRRAARRPARVRRVPVDPQRPRRPRDRPVPALALERLAPGEQDGLSCYFSGCRSANARQARRQVGRSALAGSMCLGRWPGCVDTKAQPSACTSTTSRSDSIRSAQV